MAAAMTLAEVGTHLVRLPRTRLLSAEHWQLAFREPATSAEATAPPSMPVSLGREIEFVALVVDVLRGLAPVAAAAVDRGRILRVALLIDRRPRSRRSASCW